MPNTILGKVSITPRGEYSPTETYKRLDAVQYGGNLYLCAKTCIGVTPEDGEYYMLATERGKQGDVGPTPNLSIGEVATLAPGSDAAVTITGTPEAPVLNFGIPLVAVDDTLKESGKAADAKATGDAISNLSKDKANQSDVDELKGDLIEFQNGVVIRHFDDDWHLNTSVSTGNGLVNIHTSDKQKNASAFYVKLKVGDTVHIDVDAEYQTRVYFIDKNDGTYEYRNNSDKMSYGSKEFPVVENYDYMVVVFKHGNDDKMITDADLKKISIYTVGETVEHERIEMLNDSVNRHSAKLSEIEENYGFSERTTSFSDMTLKEGYYLNGGVEKEMEGFAISDFVEVENGSSVFIHFIRYHATNSGVALYDENKNYLGDVPTEQITFDFTYITNNVFDASFISPNAKYIRYTIETSIEGKTMLDGNIYHVSDLYTKVVCSGKIYATPTDLKQYVKNADLASVLLNGCDAEPKKILTWVDDDTNSDVYISVVKGICDNLGIKCTFATITDRWGTSNSAKLETLHQYQKEGFHITSHTGNHKRWYTNEGDLPKFTALELETDLVESLEALIQEGFIDSDMLVYPGGSATRTDVDVIGIVKKWCSAGVLAGGTNWSKYGQGKYKINRTFFDKSAHDSAYYKGLLDTIKNEGWVLFGSHSATETQFDASMITEVLQYALNNGWKIMTLNEAIKYRQKYYNIQEMFGL